MKICVTGGAGYVGTSLVPALIRDGHEVTVLDLFWFGDYLPSASTPVLRKIIGDIRGEAVIDKAFKGQDAVIHLACVSNDPSFDVKPELGTSINYDAFENIMRGLNANGVKKFIYASSSSVYGVSDLEQVVEGSPKNPLTDYSKLKLKCEEDLIKADPCACWTIVRPATVCGYSPRQRLDLAVNVLTIQALTRGKMIVHGGEQFRPNVDIKDMVRAYTYILDETEWKVHKKIFNVGCENLKLIHIAGIINDELGGKIDIQIQPIKDERSYRVNSDYFQSQMGFEFCHSVRKAVKSLSRAYAGGQFKEPLKNPEYYNILQMKAIGVL